MDASLLDAAHALNTCWGIVKLAGYQIVTRRKWKTSSLHEALVFGFCCMSYQEFTLHYKYSESTI